jgi:hypothetical protein
MKKLILIIAVFAGMIFFLGNGIEQAEPRVKTYKEAIKDKGSPEYKILESIIGAMGNGMTWGNTYAEDLGGRIYCPPDKLALNNENYMDILEDNMDSNPTFKEDDCPLGLILIEGLIKTFPCPDPEPSK